MSRRRRAGDPPGSTNPGSYSPGQADYWFHGGKWIPPEEIKPMGSAPRLEHTRPHERPPTRAASIGKMLDDLVEKLPAVIAEYRDLHLNGVNALPEYLRDRVREQRHVSEPNSLHYALGRCYRDIAYAKIAIPAFKAMLAVLEKETAPLFHWGE